MKPVPKCPITMKDSVVALLVLLCAPFVQAQEERFPFAGAGGRPVAAHYVRLEGVGSQLGHGLLRDTQTKCEMMGRSVQLPPEGSPISRMRREDYYTATHLIQYTSGEVLIINPRCELEWTSIKPELVVHHPWGVCSLNVRTRTAKGQCDSTRQGPVVPLPTLRLQIEVLGADPDSRCVRTATEIMGIRSVQCIEARPESEDWRSYVYRGGPDRRGIVLESRGTSVPSGEVLSDIRAVEIRRNITVGSDMLDLARTQGFSFR
jgi:hypothetical protein